MSTAKTEGAKAAVVAHSGAGWQLLAFAEVLLISIWLGSMVFFSFVVAPSAFRVLESRHLAGLMVSSAIRQVEVMGLAIGSMLVLIQAAAWRARRPGRESKSLRIILTVVMMGAAALSRFWVSPAMNSLREAMGGVIDQVSETDPLRIQFNDLHQYSVALMSMAMFSGLALLFLTVRSWLKR